MNRQIRLTGYTVFALFVVLILYLTYIQTIHAGALNANPRNSLSLIHAYSHQRGPIVSSDGVTLAESVETNGTFKFLRVYPKPDIYSHVAGYISVQLGSAFAERAFNGPLTGSDAPVTLETIIERLEGDLAGDQVTLTVDSRVQDAAANALAGRSGAIFALDPKTGAVLASYSNPSYDPNLISSHDIGEATANKTALDTDPAKPLLARAFQERFPPGSTFKIVTASAALSTGTATLNSTFPVQTQISLPQTSNTLQNFGGSACGGTLIQSFAKSCNTVFGQLALDVGATAMSQQAEAYGFNNDTPFNFSSVQSNYPNPADVSPPLLAFSGIGQGDVTATPMEMALVSAGVANGGIIMTPQIAKQVVDNKGNILSTFDPKQWRRAISIDVAGQLTEMMIAVVDGGTGTAAKIPGVTVAGKTGTAQNAGPDHAWFTGFAPVDDPKVAVAVIIENGSGATAAARQVLQAALSAQ